MAMTKRQKTDLPEVKRGRPSSEMKPERDVLLNLYVKESKSIREISVILGCKKDLVHYWLKKYGIELRKMAKRSGLLKYNLDDIKEEVKRKGIRGYAKELGINPSTLSRFLRSEYRK